MTIKDINISIFQYVRTKQREFKWYWTLYVELFLPRCSSFLVFYYLYSCLLKTSEVISLVFFPS
jgi:hypothetical protein